MSVVAMAIHFLALGAHSPGQQVEPIPFVLLGGVSVLTSWVVGAGWIAHAMAFVFFLISTLFDIALLVGILLISLLRYLRVEGRLSDAYQEIARRIETEQALHLHSERQEEMLETHTQALQASQERLRLALQAAKQGWYDLNVQTGEAEVNDEYARMLGYDPATFSQTLEGWLEDLHPEDRARTERRYRDYVAGRIPDYRVDFRMRTREGDWKWVSSLGSIVERDERGQPLRMLGIHTDITERKAAEEALRERNRFIETILDNLPIGVAIHDARLNQAMYLNAEIGQIYGWPREILVDFERLLRHAYPDPDYRRQVREQIEAGFASGERAHMQWDELSIVRPDGARRIISVTNIPMGEPDLVIALVQDVTERVEAERVLRRYADRLNALHQIDRAILAAHAPRQIARQTLALLRRLVPCQRASLTEFDVEQEMARVLAVSTDVDTLIDAGVTMPLSYFDDVELLAEGQICVVKDIAQAGSPSRAARALQGEGIRSYANLPLLAEGRLLGSLNIALDQPGGFSPEQMSMAREAANQLAISLAQARLRQELERRKTHLQRLNQQLVSLQEEERRRLSLELHDEAGQGLTALKIDLSLLAADVPPEATALRARLNEASELLDQTMAQIRGLAHDLRPPALDAVGLNAALESFCLDFADRSGLAVTYSGVELAALPSEIQIALYRVAQEALTNVSKHAHAEQIQVSLQCTDHAATLVVDDDGEGFSPARLWSEPDRRPGIGLLGMRERLEVHGGTLDVHSQPGQGTRIVANVPYKEECP